MGGNQGRNWFFGICQIWVGFCQIWVGSGFVKYGRQDLSHMGCTEGGNIHYYLDPPCPVPSFIWSLSLGLGFVKYGLVFWVLSFCLGFVKYGRDLSQK